MRDFVIKNGLLLSPVDGYYQVKKDIRVHNGKIAEIADEINCEHPVVDAAGFVVTPGFIDIHTHCNPDTFLGLEPDVLGLVRGSTTILDAGSSGCDNYEKFHEHISKSRTKVYTLLNVSKEGLIRGHELDSMDKIDIEGLEATLEKYSDNIVGLKARASASVVGEMGLTPIAKAAELAKKVGKPLMVHVGNYPPALTEVLELLGKNDIVTHAYHGKNGGILTKDGEIIPEAIAARERGVMFDVGHGAASLSLRVFEKALAKGFNCDLISTDLHEQNYNGPVHNIANVLSKIWNCGDSLENVIHKCTSAPARHFGLKGLGELKEGFIADFNFVTLEACEEEVVDSIGDTIVLKEKIVVHKSIYSKGEYSEVFEPNS